MNPAAEARFWSKVQRTDGCWIWQGSRNPEGYGYAWAGRFGNKNRLVGAHRVAYRLLVGEADAYWQAKRAAFGVRAAYHDLSVGLREDGIE